MTALQDPQEQLPGKPTAMSMVAPILAGDDQIDLYDIQTQDLDLWISLAPGSS